MKRFSSLLVLLCLICFSYSAGKKEKLSTFKAGTYGVCSGNSQVLLKISPDNTFCYSDHTLRQPLQVTGTWTRAGNVIILEYYGNPSRIHDHWKIEAGAMCLKSRKGMEWRRLCRLDAE